ncbi:MAG: arginine--tRNA ligase [Bacteroidales bacterium]|nr:arginine--tRNA ligase [Bacteroidales bacterium]MDD2425326.1 arginine--tRNA ligase [Bacteroidales bacterium]MDD3989388.1 arginine--tRNA ligase [Bacteroidales bacterium]MDD4638906.1 arginine--tRNA ligase [Bacteroidales bacterium]
MNPEKFIEQKMKEAVKDLYKTVPDDKILQTQVTRREFEGDITAVIFPLLKISGRNPEQTGQELGEYIKKNTPEIEKFNVVKGFLNLKFTPAYWLKTLSIISTSHKWGYGQSTGKTVMVEFSSPNTNKPLHLGHIRNNLLGWSISRLLEANGHRVIKVNLVNDRGIHICKSMLAWLKNAGGETPQIRGVKGDHFVGDYYVDFNRIYKKEVEELKLSGYSQEEAEKEAPVLKEAQQMLVEWEQGKNEVVELWKKMNSWVYEGFDQTYKSLGVAFDKTYYESKTYLLGKELVKEGLERGVFFRKDDGSVWCDLTSEGLDEKLLLRSDGTSVYMTQDLGTAHQRFSEYKLDEHIYVVGNEQNYHFQVLKLILKKLGYEWSDSIYHLSYGMVELPEGKMKSREGTVVDADDLIETMISTARETSLELGKLENMAESEKEELFEMLGLGALKYFILKVDPKKTMLFDPNESIDFNGNTGPFIQYTHARIRSIIRKSGDLEKGETIDSVILNEKEIQIIKLLNIFPEKIAEAGKDHSPALIANYAFELAREFNQYYHEYSIIRETDISVRSMRLILINTIAVVLANAMDILGIKLPERM